MVEEILVPMTNKTVKNSIFYILKNLVIYEVIMSMSEITSLNCGHHSTGDIRAWKTIVELY
jgi:hypothetical protein